MNTFSNFPSIESRKNKPAHTPRGTASVLMRILFACSVLLVSATHAEDTEEQTSLALHQHPKLQAIADQLIAEQHYSQQQLDDIFARADYLQSVLDAMQNPAEYKFTWGKYRKLFMQEDRIQQGVDFWLQHQASLQRAEQQYAVPASVIVAIIGVESKYGKYRGKHKVLDSLATLVVGFPRRSAFFADELKQFLILSKENQLNSNEVLGSYAGAVGYPQFISSSYRNYAVDFSGDGVIDLINQPIDAIGSIANYFIENGWKPGQPVTSVAHPQVDPRLVSLANRKRQVKFSAAELKSLGAVLDPSISDQERLNVLMLDANEVVNEPSNNNIYVVRAGDTACQIAERFEMPCKRLFELNRLNNKGAIFRGQRLKIIDPAKSSDSKWAVAQNVSEELQPQPRYFYTHHNFYAITKYNHSVLYAMAVHELSQAIAQAKQQRDALGEPLIDLAPVNADSQNTQPVSN